MKYLLFAGHRYYPRGGVNDLFGVSENIKELQRMFTDNAEAIADGSYIDNWAQIVDSEMNIIMTGTQAHISGDLKTPGVTSWSNKNDHD